tara:strand:+ start:29 stop:577 length:549 start_codon:yes stop_codon:yes gene_type:complete
MIKDINILPPTKIKIELANNLKPGDIEDLCDATETAILEGGGFGWIKVPSRKTLKDYWLGVMTVPDRELIIGRVDNVVAGSCQIIKPSKNNEAQRLLCNLTTFFIAPWARGHGISPKLILFAEKTAVELGFKIITLDVRESQKRAIEIIEQNNFKKFGTNPFYAVVSNDFVSGFYYYKKIKS